MIVATGVYLDEDDHKYSATLIIDSMGEILGCTKKMHITRQPDFYEQDYFDPGREAPLVCETEIGTLGVVACYDRHYPELTRYCALKGAEVIITPTGNSVAENLKMLKWEIRVAAFQNNVFMEWQ
jgi:N-carbamoylputrescine amidase